MTVENGNPDTVDVLVIIDHGNGRTTKISMTQSVVAITRHADGHAGGGFIKWSPSESGSVTINGRLGPITEVAK